MTTVLHKPLNAEQQPYDRGTQLVLKVLTPIWDDADDTFVSATSYPEVDENGVVTLVLKPNFGTNIDPQGGSYQLIEPNQVEHTFQVLDSPTPVWLHDLLTESPSPSGNIVIGVQDIVVDSVTTGNAGSSATVQLTGVAPTLHASFSIPRGADGAAGSPGAPGAPGSNGTYQGFEVLSALGTKTGAFNIDLSGGATCFSLTLSGNAVATFTNVPSGSKVITVLLRITQGAGAYTFDVTNRKGPFGSNQFANLSSAAGAVDVYAATSWDGGATWECAPVMQGIA